MWSDKFYELFIILPSKKTEIEFKLGCVFDTFLRSFKQGSLVFLVLSFQQIDTCHSF